MARKGYRKPRIEKVKLVAEEAVLTACKISNVLGPGTINGGREIGCTFEHSISCILDGS